MQKATSDSGRSFKSLLSSYYLSRSKRSLFSNWFSFRQGRQADDVASDDAVVDSSNDASNDANNDASNDASNDSSNDAAVDSSNDASDDAVVDSSNDASNDASDDSSNDASDDSSNDAVIDSSDDSSNDAVVDSSDDSSNDASDSSDDASSDASADASADDGQCPSSSGRSGRLIIIDPVLTRSFAPLSLANFVVFSAGAGKYMGFYPIFKHIYLAFNYTFFSVSSCCCPSYCCSCKWR